MNWKFVFNSNHNSQKWGDIDRCLAFVKTTGYKFFIWNGSVYDLRGEDTGITVDDLI